MHWAAYGSGTDSAAPIVRDSSRMSCPPSVLLSPEESQALRLDCWFPPHPIGTGEHWPPEASVNRELGSGRFPLAAAWFGRLSNQKWRWRVDGDERILGSLDAICFAVSQLAKINARHNPCVVVIPNDFQQHEQQRLLDDCNAIGLNASLLWLPIAASLAWIDENKHALPDPNQNRGTELSVVVVHCDWGVIRLSKLKLVVNEKDEVVCWVPARSRPTISDMACAGFGWYELSACTAENAQDVWRNLFVTRSDCQNIAHLNSCILQEIQNWRMTFENSVKAFSIKGDTFSSDEARVLSICSKAHSIQDLHQKLISIAKSSNLLFVGDFAKSIASSDEISSLRRDHQFFIADGIKGEQLLAKGASIFSQNQEEGRLSYLDTLPKLELFVDRGNQYEWISLLGEADKFVAGGQEWQLQEPIRGLSIRQGASSVKLAVCHEDEFVRELRVLLEGPTSAELAATLFVSATPAQGNAKLKLVTDAAFGRTQSAIYANWKTMKAAMQLDQPVRKDEYAKTQPRAYPNLSVRPANEARWLIFEKRVGLFLASSQSTQRSLFSTISLSKILDSVRFVNGCSAISSEGSPPQHFINKKRMDLVVELTKYLFDKIRRSPTSFQPQQSEMLKVLAYMSARVDGLEEFIETKIRSNFYIDELTCIVAGNCIRRADLAATFITKLLDYIPKSSQQRLLNYQMQAIARLISQREDALSMLSETQAYVLLDACLKVFKHELEEGNLNWLFEHSGLVVVYTLRFRINNPEFLAPDSKKALEAKELFSEAIKTLRAKLSKGEQEELPTIEIEGIPGQQSNRSEQFSNRTKLLSRKARVCFALFQLIAYIDKKGEGIPLFSLSD